MFNMILIGSCRKLRFTYLTMIQLVEILAFDNVMMFQIIPSRRYISRTDHRYLVICLKDNVAYSCLEIYS